MKRINVIAILALIAVVLAMMAVPAMAETRTIDGDLDDWGVNPGFSDWLADDPARSAYNNWKGGPTNDGPVNDPGVEKCDLEALYVVDGYPDNSYIYIAMITSMPPGGFSYSGSLLVPGDIALNMDNDPTTGEYGYEYGIKLTTASGTVTGLVGDVFKNPDWYKRNPEVAQSDIEFSNMKAGAGTKTGQVDAMVYQTYLDWSSDNGATNYVIEMAVPKSALGITSGGEADFVVSVSCTNDVLIIEDFSYEIPEFTTVAIPVGMIIGLFYFFSRKRKQ